MEFLSALFDHPTADQTSDDQSVDHYLFSGNRHETVPRLLFLDQRLTPLERNAWQILRLQLNQDGVTAFPTYDQLSPYLASSPCGSKASHETIARALILLRLTRWISLVRRRRDHKTGQIRSNLYVLHDEPLTPFEAIQLDPLYLELLSKALSHASKAIQRVGLHVIEEITLDPQLNNCVLPSRLERLAQRLKAHYPQQAIHQSEVSKNSLLRIDEPLSSESEVADNACISASIRNPKSDRTSKNKKEVLTVLKLPQRFEQLKAEQQAGIFTALKSVDSTLHQLIFDEWDSRCQHDAIRNPAGYLFGLIQKAIKGEFKAWASTQHPPKHPGIPLKYSTNNCCGLIMQDTI